MKERLIILFCGLHLLCVCEAWGQKEPRMSNIPQVSCLHTDGGLDSLQFPGGHNQFYTLYIYIDSLLRTGKGRLNILHIGGSHVQGGMFTHRMRLNLDSLGGCSPIVPSRRMHRPTMCSPAEEHGTAFATCNATAPPCSD